MAACLSLFIEMFQTFSTEILGNMIANLDEEQRPKNVLCVDCGHALWSLSGDTEQLELTAYCMAMGDFMYRSSEPVTLENCSNYKSVCRKC